MARIRVTYWQEIPVLVTARDGADEVTVPLSQRFQELVDAVAMQAGVGDAAAYLAGWRTGPEEERAGPAAAAAGAVAAELEAGFPDIRARHLRPGGPFDAHG
jgi:Virulence factor